MQEVVFIVLMLLVIRLVMKSIREPFYIIFLLPFAESNMWGSISYKQSMLLSGAGITIYYTDIIKFIIMFYVLYNFKNIKSTKYTKLFSIIASMFILSVFIRIVSFGDAFNLNELKNFFRNIIPLIYPYFIIKTYKEELETAFIKEIVIISLVSIFIFFLEYFFLYTQLPSFDIYNTASEVTKVNIKETATTLNRFIIQGGIFVSISAALLVLKYNKIKKWISVSVIVGVLLIFFLSTYRTSFLIVVVTFMLAYLWKSREQISNTIFIGITIITLFLLVDAFGVVDIQSSLFRVLSTYDEMKYQEGSGLVRLIKNAAIWEIIIKEIASIVPGYLFSTRGKELYEYIALDIGILSTIALHGLIMTIALLNIVFKKIFSKKIFIISNLNADYLILLRCFIISSIPAIILTHELYAYFINNISILIGLALAEQNILLKTANNPQ